MSFGLSIQGARDAWGPDWANASDDEVLRAYARSNGLSLGQAADALGYDHGRGSMQGERWSSSIDSYQAGYLGLGEAVAGAVGASGVAGALGARRRANETQANVAAERAKGLGAIDSYKDVTWYDPAEVWNYGSGLAIQSAPYLAETVVGGALGRLGALGPRTALSVADELGMEAAKAGAQRSLNAASLAGAGAAGYPSAVGDILQNQRDTGQPTDLGMALAGGVPYAALNLLGPESTLAKGRLFRNAWGGLDRIGGVSGALARTGATVATQGALEGVGETGQELVNQYFGRMAVDPNETLFSPEAQDRYAESFVGGATLGGALGGAFGGWRRGQFPNAGPAPGEPAPTVDVPNFNLLTDAGPLQGRLDAGMRIGQRYAGKGYENQFEAAYAEPSGRWVIDPETQQERQLSMGEYLDMLARGRSMADRQFQVGTRPPMPTEGEWASYDYNRRGISDLERNPEELASLDLAERAQLSPQPDLFDFYNQRPAPVDSRGFMPLPPREPDPYTGDLFQQRPDAAVRTDFTPDLLLRELSAANDGVKDPWTVRLALGLSRIVENPAAARDAIGKLRTKLERLFDVETDDPMEGPFRSEKERNDTIQRLYVLDAAENIIDRYQQRMTDAQVQAAAARGARPGETNAVGPTPAPSSATEEMMRGRNRAQAASEQAAAARAWEAEKGQDREARARRRVLAEVLGDPTTNNARGRFTARLKKLGFKDTALRPSETASIDRWNESRAAYTEPGQGELNLGAVTPGETRVPAGAPAPVVQPDQRNQYDLFDRRKNNAIQKRSAARLDVRQQAGNGEALAKGNAQGQTPIPSQQAAANEKGRPRPVKPYSEYDGVSVEIPVRSGDRDTSIKVPDAGKRLRELETKAEKYRTLIACLS